MTQDSMAYLKNNDGNARRYYLRSACSRSVFIYSFDTLIRIHSTYIINTYIPLMDRVNSMVMVEKLKRTLVEELRPTLAQRQIYKKRSNSVGTKSQVESFFVILDVCRVAKYQLLLHYNI
jgi:hypothetical protein